MNITNRIMSKKILVRPNPFPDESFLGYFIRLANNNGCESLIEFLRLIPNSTIYYNVNKDIKIDKFNDPSIELIFNLAELTQKHPQTILDLTVFPSENRKLSTFSEQPLHSLIYPNVYKFCVLCLRENNYHRKIWNIIILTVCPIHKCLLNYKCSFCKKNLKNSHAILSKCKCGFDLQETEPKLVSEYQTTLAKYIYILTGMLRSENIPLSRNNPLINYSLKYICQIIYYYTQRVFRLNSLKPFRLSKLIDQENLHESVHKAFLIFDDFPESYLLYLEELVRNPNYMKRKNWFDYFAANYNDYQRVIPYSLTSLLYKIFDQNIDKILFRNNKKVSRANLPRLISHSVLAGQLGIKLEDVVNLLQNGDIKKVGSEIKQKKILHLIHGDTFYKIMRQIRLKKRANSKYKFKEIMQLTQILNYLSEHNISFHVFLSLVLKGKIKYCSENYSETGLHRFLFLRNDVEKFIKSQTEEI